jgi:NAD(P)H-flavin reductase
MHSANGQIVELILEADKVYARISCPPHLIPPPGQYVLASSASLSDPLPVSLFSTESTPSGFIACAPFPSFWTPGTEIVLHGPLGRGFRLPSTARKVALIAFDGTAERLKGLIRPALSQGAAVTLVSEADETGLPEEVEVQPLAALEEALRWADYAALDVLRENLAGVWERLGGERQVWAGKEAQVLVRTPLPCAGIAECGVCAVSVKAGWRLACKDGPVFDWGEVVG